MRRRQGQIRIKAVYDWALMVGYTEEEAIKTALIEIIYR
jgi:hypothetical protein